MPSKTKKQQNFFRLVWLFKNRKLKNKKNMPDSLIEKIKKTAESMSKDDIQDFLKYKKPSKKSKKKKKLLESVKIGKIRISLLENAQKKPIMVAFEYPFYPLPQIEKEKTLNDKILSLKYVLQEWLNHYGILTFKTNDEEKKQKWKKTFEKMGFFVDKLKSGLKIFGHVTENFDKRVI